MKKLIITGYVVMTLVLSVFYSVFGKTADKPYSYNLGQAAVWPISLVLYHTL